MEFFGIPNNNGFHHVEIRDENLFERMDSDKVEKLIGLI